MAISAPWSNNLGGVWSNPLNWNPNQVPGSTDTAVITNGGIGLTPMTVTLDTSPTISNIFLGGNAPCGLLNNAGQVLSMNGQTLTFSGALW